MTNSGESRDDADSLPQAEESAAPDENASGDPGESSAEETGEWAGPGARESEVAAEAGEALDQLRAELQENWQRLARVSAEFDNYRKRTERELDAARKFGIERFAGDILAVKDSLELGLEAARKETDLRAVIEGLEATLKLLVQTLERHGVTEIDPQGENFDPRYHEAMSAQPSEDVPPDTVVAVFQKGYLIHERLLRPARVVVSTAPAA